MLSQFIGFLNKPLRPPLIKHTYSKEIEQYRGLCALMVMVSHGFVHPEMLVNNFKWPVYLEYIGAGFLSVLIFFCISGYVIGINYDRSHFSIKDYLKKRAVRLYPIYIFAIILCVIVTGGVSFFLLSGNVLFLQNEFPYVHFNVPVYLNYVSWSLNYEVVYYLLFIALFYLRPKVWVLLSGLLILSLLFMHASTPFIFFSNYVNGFYFWLAGLLIAWGFFNGKTDKNISVPLISLLFLHLCQAYLGIGVIILHIVYIYATTGLNWLFDLPFCIMIICILTGKDNIFLRFNKIFCYVIPAFVFAYLLLNQRLFENERWIMCFIFWILSLAFYFEKKISAFLLNKLTYVGHISYALYLFHVPVALLVRKFVFISDPKVEIPVKYFLWFSITFILAIFLELKVQPVIKRYFFTK